jgi:nicotinamidase-related amidase
VSDIKNSLTLLEKKIPVLYCNDAHIKGMDREPFLWRNHAIKGTDGADVMDSRDLLGEL